MPAPKKTSSTAATERAKAVKSTLEILRTLTESRDWGNTVLSGLLGGCATLCTSSMFLFGAMSSGSLSILTGIVTSLLLAAVGILLTMLIHRKISMPLKRKSLIKDLRRAIESCPTGAETLDAARRADAMLLAKAEAMFDIAQALQDYKPFHPDNVVC